MIEIFSDDDLNSLQVTRTTACGVRTSDKFKIQDELQRIQDRIARKKARKSVKQETGPPADDIIDLT